MVCTNPATVAATVRSTDGLAMVIVSNWSLGNRRSWASRRARTDAERAAPVSSPSSPRIAP